MDEQIRLAARGDPGAQAELLREVQDLVYRFCLSQLFRPHLCEDATQETALRLLRGLGSFSGRSSFRTWVLGIAINVCREMRRREANHQAASQAWLERPNANLATEPVQLLEMQELGEQLHVMLEQLSQRQREVVVLRILEELSVAETSRILGIRQGTVKATLHQALSILRDRHAALKDQDR